MTKPIVTDLAVQLTALKHVQKTPSSKTGGTYSNQFLSTLEHRGHYTYHHFNIQQFYVLPTQCIYVFCVDLRTNSDYFPIQH